MVNKRGYMKANSYKGFSGDGFTTMLEGQKISKSLKDSFTDMIALAEHMSKKLDNMTSDDARYFETRAGYNINSEVLFFDNLKEAMMKLLAQTTDAQAGFDTLVKIAYEDLNNKNG